MKIKRLLLVNGFVLGLLATANVAAQNQAGRINTPLAKSNQCQQVHHKKLTPEQRDQLRIIRHNTRGALQPLIKEKRALRVQIKEAIIAPHAQWSQVAVLVDKINVINNKIALVVVKSRFEAFQKLGIVTPVRHHSHCHHVQKIAQH